MPDIEVATTDELASELLDRFQDAIILGQKPGKRPEDAGEAIAASKGNPWLVAGQCLVEGIFRLAKLVLKRFKEDEHRRPLE